MYWNRRLTRLETGLYAIVAGILILFLSERLLQMFEVAERTAMETTLMRANSAINTQAALQLMVAKDRTSDWQQRNPFELARLSPSNYVEGGAASVPPGSWTFEEGSGALLYKPRLKRGLITDSPDGMLRFRLTRPTQGGTFMLAPTSTFVWQ